MIRDGKGAAAALVLIVGLMLVVFVLLAGDDYTELVASVQEPQDRECVMVKVGLWACKPLETPTAIGQGAEH